jgi:hypothetical protein
MIGYYNHVRNFYIGDYEAGVHTDVEKAEADRHLEARTNEPKSRPTSLILLR